MNTEKKERTVVHVELADGEHFYFGSIANIFEYFDVEKIGISYGALRNFGLSNEKAYHNTKCTIRKGVLLAKKSNRGRKKEKE